MTTKGAIALGIAIIIATAMVLLYDHNKTETEHDRQDTQWCLDRMPKNYISPIGCN